MLLFVWIYIGNDIDIESAGDLKIGGCFAEDGAVLEVVRLNC